MGEILKESFLPSLIFGCIMGLMVGFLFMITEGLVTGLIISAIIAFIAGGLFFVLIAIFRYIAKPKEKFPAIANEEILKEGGANYMNGLEGIGGYMYLTHERLYFKSHGVNFTEKELNLPFSQIQDFRPESSLGIIPNRIILKDLEGKEYTLVVGGRRKWISALGKVIQNA